MLMPSIFGENLFDDFFDFPLYDEKPGRMQRNMYGRRAAEMMKTDIKETDTGYELEIDLPGFKKEDVQASLKNGYLTIQASTDSSNDEKDEKDGHYIRRERYYGSCQRSFYIGEDVKQEDIKAEFKQGILKLSVPKKEEKPAVEENRYIAIE